MKINFAHLDSIVLRIRMFREPVQLALGDPCKVLTLLDLRTTHLVEAAERRAIIVFLAFTVRREQPWYLMYVHLDFIAQKAASILFRATLAPIVKVVRPLPLRV